MTREGHQAFQILRFGFTVAPIVAGLDKFLGLLTNWDKYLAPGLSFGIAPHTFMMIVGVIEIVAGLIVAVRPRIGGYIVAVWLVGIMVNLVAVGGYLDVALRDLGLCLGAIALARLAEAEVRVGVPANA
jgi:uncharacterized membrane protein YphA (DoxX/SURF4 family)